MALQHPCRQRRGRRRVLLVPFLGAVRHRARPRPARQPLRRLPGRRQPHVEHVSAPAQLLDVAGNSDIRGRLLLQRAGHHGAGALRHLRVHGVPSLDGPAGRPDGRSGVRVFAVHRLAVRRPSVADPAHERAPDAHPGRPAVRGAVRQSVGGRFAPRPAGVGADPDGRGSAGHGGGDGGHRPGGPVRRRPPGGGPAPCLRATGLGRRRRALRRALGPVPGRPVLRT